MVFYFIREIIVTGLTGSTSGLGLAEDISTEENLKQKIEEQKARCVSYEARCVSYEARCVSYEARCVSDEGVLHVCPVI